MRLVTLSLLSTLVFATFASSAHAEAATVLDDEGKIWVMQIVPAGANAEASTAEQPRPVSESATETSASTDEPSDEANESETAAPAKPASTSAATETSATSPMVPLPEAPIPAAPIVISDFGMTIVPRGCEPDVDLAQHYRQIYKAIPFNRAEYVANPAYRHDATMELLTGNPRPTAGYTRRTVRNRQYTGYRPYLQSSSDHYRYRYPAGYGLYGFGRLPYMGLAF